MTTQQTRRNVLRKGTALVGTGLIGVGGYSLLTDPVTAEVTSELSVTGDEAETSDAPERIDISVSGDYSITAPKTPEKVETIMQTHIGGKGELVEDLAFQVDFDTYENSFSITEDVYQHPDVSKGFFMPGSGGETKTTEIYVRTVCRITYDGKLQGEEFTGGSADITLTKTGAIVSLGASGSVTIVT